MATGATIQSVLADVRTNDISFEDMALIVKRAILNALIDNNSNCIIPISSVGKDGATVNMPIEQATALMDQLLKLASGGVVAQTAEFQDPPKSPWLR